MPAARTPRDKRARLTVALALGAMLGATLAACGDAQTQADAEANEADAQAAGGGVAGEVTAVTGPGGLASDQLAEGTFLGKGAKLDAGQAIETPRGTLAEVEMNRGARIRLNEQTAVEMPGADHPDQLVLKSGEIVVIAAGHDASRELRVVAGDETLRVEDGEVQVRNAGDERYYAVVTGRAVLETEGRDPMELGPGESVTAPLPAQEPLAQPELSLRPLEDTVWARSFDTAARLATTVPRGVGSLTARRAGSRSEQQRLRLTDQKVTVNIAGRLAHTEIEQAFFNERGVVLEGIYRFPLPTDGSISGLSLLVGQRWMDGEIVEKQRGRAIFQQIVDATIPRDPALLEWERGNIFKLRIFPIPGRGDRRVRLSYTQVLPVVGNSVRYRYPLGGSGASDVPIDNFSFEVNIDRSELNDEQVANIATPMLALSRSDAGEQVTLATQRSGFLPTFDLGVDIPAPKAAHTVHTTTHLDKDGQAYFMLAMRPQFELGKDKRPVHYAFVMDRSHSTTPELWTLARGLVDAMADMMDNGDRFTVLACDTACDESPAGLQPASAAAMDGAQQFLEQQDLAGASDLGGMLTQASDALGRGASDAAKIIVYLGDGAPTSGELAADKLAKLVRAPLADARVLAVALGARSDVTSLGAIVQSTGGDVLRADPRDNLRELVRELRLRVAVPVARDIEFEAPEGMTALRHQAQAGIRPGDTVFLAGKLAHAVTGEVKLRARGPQGPVEVSFPVELAAREGAPQTTRHLPRTWAAMEIQHLTQTQGFGARDQIIALSKDYTVLSRFTSLIVLENDAMFREFNVVRKAKDTDTWKGKLPESEPEPVLEAGASAHRELAANDASGLRHSDPSSQPKAAEADRRTELDRTKSGGAAPSGGAPPSEDPPPPPTASSRVQGGPARDFGGDLGNDEGRFGFEEQRNRGKDKFDGFEPSEPPIVRDGVDDGVEADEARPRRREPEKKRKAKKPATTKSPPSDPFPGARGKSSGRSGNVAGGSTGSLGSGSRRGDSRRTSGGWMGPRRRFIRRLNIRRLNTPSRSALARVESLARRAQADPTKRTAHSRLVHAALRAGHADTLSFARAWAEADPDHAPALLTLADALAAAGDPLAGRAYESAVEVAPFSRAQHESLAAALTSKGDLQRACSHRRAVVSIDPSRGEHHAELAKCLARAGRATDARAAIVDGELRARRDKAILVKTSRVLDAGLPAAAPLHSAAQLRATLTWTGEDDLDIAIVDRRGRRLSNLRPVGIRVREGAGSEALTMRTVKGSVFVEVTRAGLPSESGRPPPVRGTLKLRTSSGIAKTIDFTLVEGSGRVARVFWQTI